MMIQDSKEEFRIYTNNNRILFLNTTIIISLIVTITAFSISFETFSAYATLHNTNLENKTANTTVRNNNFLTYSNPEYEFRIDYPATWVIEQEPTPFDPSVMFIAPNDKGGFLDFQENLIVSAEDISIFENKSLRYLIDININNLKNSLKDFNIEEITPIENLGNINNQSALRVDFTNTMQFPVLGEVPTTLIAIYTIKGDTLYTISSNIESDKYSDYLPIVQRMIDSFEIIAPPIIENTAISSLTTWNRTALQTTKPSIVEIRNNSIGVETNENAT